MSKGPQSLDDLNFSGDKFLSGETKRQIEELYESGVVEIVLKHYGIPKSQAYAWYQELHGERKAVCECLPHVAPDFPHRLTVTKLKYDLKRVTSLSYASLEASPLGEAVAMYGADCEPNWIVTDLPFMAGHIVVGKREFPLETPFVGYVVSGEDDQCYLLCPLRPFLLSRFCKKPY